MNKRIIDLTALSPNLTGAEEFEIDKSGWSESNRVTLDVIKEYINISDIYYFDTTIGGVDAVYPATSIANGIEQALADGHRVFKVLDDFSQFGDWGTITEEIVLIGNGEYKTITMSISNTSILKLKGDLIKFQIIGTNTIFSESTTLKFDRLYFEGDTSSNVVSISPIYIYVQNLYINTGTAGSFNIVTTIYADYMSVVSGNTSNTGISLSQGNIDTLVLSGSFGSSPESGVRLNGTQIGYVINNATGSYPLTFAGSNTSIHRSTGNAINVYPTGARASNLYLNKCVLGAINLGGSSNAVITNCTYTTIIMSLSGYLKIYDNTGGDITIGNLSYIGISACEILRNKITGNLTFVDGDNHLSKDNRISGNMVVSTYNFNSQGDIISGTLTNQGDYNTFRDTQCVNIIDNGDYTYIDNLKVSGIVTDNTPLTKRMKNIY